jgi:hypothetical protein
VPGSDLGPDRWLRGREVGIRIEPATLMFYDLTTRKLLRTRKNP